MTLRCAILDDYQGVALGMADWAGLAPQVTVETFTRHFASTDDLVAAIGGCEIVVIMRERTPFPAALLARLPKLKLLVTTGPRNFAIDLDAAARHGVTVCGTEAYSHPTAELTWALILALARHIPAETAGFRAGGWQRTVGIDLAGKQLGILGLGRLGAKVAGIARAFDMKVAAWSQNLTAARCAEHGVAFAPSLDALLAEADIVSIHVVLGDRTRGLIGAAQLARMKPGALLVNTSRGPIVDEAALVAALGSGRLAGAGIDVYDQEPLPADHPLRGIDTLIATPHLGYVTADNYRRFYGQSVEAIRAWIAGQPLRVLTPPR